MSASIEWTAVPVQISCGRYASGADVELKAVTGWRAEGLPIAVTPGVGDCAGMWVITHCRSGVALGATRFLERAKQCAEELAGIGDWNRSAAAIQRDTPFCDAARAVVERTLMITLAPRPDHAYLPDDKRKKVTSVRLPKDAR